MARGSLVRGTVGVLVDWAFGVIREPSALLITGQIVVDMSFQTVSVRTSLERPLIWNFQILDRQGLIIPIRLLLANPDLLALPLVVIVLSLAHGLDFVRRENYFTIFHFGLLGFIQIILLYRSAWLKTYQGLVHIALNNLFLGVCGFLARQQIFRLFSPRLLLSNRFA